MQWRKLEKAVDDEEGEDPERALVQFECCRHVGSKVSASALTGASLSLLKLLELRNLTVSGTCPGSHTRTYQGIAWYLLNHKITLMQSLHETPSGPRHPFTLRRPIETLSIGPQL